MGTRAGRACCGYLWAEWEIYDVMSTCRWIEYSWGVCQVRVCVALGAGFFWFLDARDMAQIHLARFTTASERVLFYRQSQIVANQGHPGSTISLAV